MFVLKDVFLTASKYLSSMGLRLLAMLAIRLRRAEGGEIMIEGRSLLRMSSLVIVIKSSAAICDIEILAMCDTISEYRIGLAHDAVIELRLGNEEYIKTIKVKGIAPGAQIIVFRRNIFASSLLALCERGALNDNPLEIVRQIDIDLGQTKKTLVQKGETAERILHSVLPHYRHVIGLAASEDAKMRAEATAKSLCPIVSIIVPVFNASDRFLRDLLGSVLIQEEGRWELIFSDDASTSSETLGWLRENERVANVTILRSQVNRGIACAANSALAIAKGEWIGLLGHDDALSPFSIARIVREIAMHPHCKLFYTDEIVADIALKPVEYFLKPAWDPVLLSGMNYINHFTVYRADRLKEFGGFRSALDSSQDYDILLRYTQGLHDHEIRHIPYPAYLWRGVEDNFSTKFADMSVDNARRALSARFGSQVPVTSALRGDFHRVRFDLVQDDWPLVSIVIPNKDSPELLAMTLQGLENTDYDNIEIIVVDNGSTDSRTLEIYERYGASEFEFRVYIEKRDFNFSYSVNKGIEVSNGVFVLLLNNDIEMSDEAWLKEMVSCFNYDDVGIVGARLLYPSGVLQHAGVIAGLGGLAGHWFIESDVDCPGPMGRLSVRQSLSCVTGACFLVSRQCLDRVGRFDEAKFSVAYNDIDFSLRAVECGFRVVWTPFASLVHHESASRGSDESPDKIDRFRREQENLRRRHGTVLLVDRFFSPWWSRHASHPKTIMQDCLPPSR